MKQESQTVICPACTLLCDDIVVSSDGSINTHGCEKGQAFFQLAAKPNLTHYVAGKPANLESAVSAAVDILNQSKAPLICGLDQLTTQAQQVAWKVADRIGATIDTTLGNYGRSSLFSLQRIGKVTASLGEISQRSDLVLFWFCDPATTHPRLLDRLNRSGLKRKIVVVGELGNQTAADADQFLEIAPDQAPEVLSILRSALSNGDTATQTDSLHSPQLIELAEQLKTAKYGSVFYGQTADDSAFDLAADSLASLIRTLNNSTPVVGMKLRSDSNAISAENVLAWSSGYAMAVNHAASFPRSNWLEHSAETVLTRRECDAVLLATGTDLKSVFAGLSQTAQQHLASIPKIILSPIANVPGDVSIALGVAGLNGSGEFCRNDDVSMPLLPLAENGEEPKSVAAVALQQIHESLQATTKTDSAMQ